MKALVCSLFLLSSALLAQTVIPPGTVLPTQLNSSLNSQKSKSGQKISARVMQDVPLPNGRKIPAGAKVIGQVMDVTPGSTGTPAQVTLKFERVEFDHQSITVNTTLRALASMLEVEAAQIPPGGTDRGTPWAWTNRDLIGDEAAYGEGGPVAHGGEIVGHSQYGGVLMPARANRAAGCRGDFGYPTQLQAFWVFSSDACGVYGIADVQISHAGRTAPLGEITLRSESGNFEIRSGSGVVLRVNEANP